MVGASRSLRSVALLAITALAAGCFYGHARTGDDNRWREDLDFERGRTRLDDVLQALGPPTQVLDLGARFAFVYMLEEQRTDGFDLASVFRDTERAFYSDRAVYFFDRAGVLEEMATSRITLPREAVHRVDPWRPVEIAEAGR